MSITFEKTRSLRISKFWRHEDKEDPATEIERKGVRKFGKQKTTEFEERCEAVSLDGEIIKVGTEIRPLNLAIMRLFITNRYLQGLLAYNSIFVFVIVFY